MKKALGASFQKIVRHTASAFLKISQSFQQMTFRYYELLFIEYEHFFFRKKDRRYKQRSNINVQEFQC